MPEIRISRTWFLLLIMAIALANTFLYINYGKLDKLFVLDDHLKFYSFTVDQADIFLRFGTPFGFNHNFQGGIPTLFLRSCFLEFIPFKLIFGERVGYQLMLIFFIVLTPVAFYFFASELTKNESVARMCSFLSAFQLGLWPNLGWGMTPVIVSVPLCLFSIVFFMRYLNGKSFSLFPLLLLSGSLAYTHLVNYALNGAFMAMLFLYVFVSQKNYASDIKRVLWFGLLSILICLPILLNFLFYSSFVVPSFGYPGARPLFLAEEGAVKNLFLIAFSLIPLALFYRLTPDTDGKKIVRNTFFFSVFLLTIPLLWHLAWAQIIVLRLVSVFAPFILVFNLSLLPLTRSSTKIKIAGIIIVFLATLALFPLKTRPLLSIDSIKIVDKEIESFISPNDYALLENSCHINPQKNDSPFDFHWGRCHWPISLQKEWGITLFSNMGEDPHPYNSYRHMYITSGTFNGEPLGDKNAEEVVSLLKDWGVNKLFVWSPTAKLFFDQRLEFYRIGKSERYYVYGVNYDIVPEVSLSGGGRGKIIQEDPFSFTVKLKGVSEKQKMTINKNYFATWLAYDEDGNKLPLKACGQKMCLDIEENGKVRFEFFNRILLNLSPLFALLLALVPFRKSLNP